MDKILLEQNLEAQARAGMYEKKKEKKYSTAEWCSPHGDEQWLMHSSIWGNNVLRYTVKTSSETGMEQAVCSAIEATHELNRGRIKRTSQFLHVFGAQRSPACLERSRLLRMQATTASCTKGHYASCPCLPSFSIVAARSPVKALLLSCSMLQRKRIDLSLPQCVLVLCTSSQLSPNAAVHLLYHFLCNVANKLSWRSSIVFCAIQRQNH